MKLANIFAPTLAAILSIGSVAHGADTPTTLKKVEATGTFTVGTRAASFPFNYLDDDNKQAGYAWEIAERITAEVKRKLNRDDIRVKPMEVTPQTRIPLVANQTVDLECSSTTHNAEREKQVSFSTSYFIVGTKLLVPAGSPIKNWTDLTDKTVAVSAGTTGERMLRTLNEERQWKANIVLSNDIDNTFMMVHSGRTMAAAIDDMVLYGLIARAKNPERWAAVGDILQPEAYACVLRKGDTEFKALVDGVITGMMKSGEMTELYNKYFLSPIKVRGGFNINAPMSEPIRDLIANPNDRIL
jgi:glutamate/aspartate transport system substrate-binding protein